jgi:hypothetical protein
VRGGGANRAEAEVDGSFPTAAPTGGGKALPGRAARARTFPGVTGLSCDAREDRETKSFALTHF